MRPLLLPLLALAACGPDPLGPNPEERFTYFGGCADVVFFAVDEGDETMITFERQGLLAAAREAGTETTTVFTLPVDGLRLVIEQGSRVSDATCDDVIENDGPRVRRTWTAAGGTATVALRPETEAGRGDLLLEDVVFTSAGEDPITLESLEWTNVSVGWYAG